MQENCDIATMKLMLPFEPKPSKHTLSYADKLLLLGSCFSDYIGMQLQRAKFQVLFNPTGIVFDPISLSTRLTNFFYIMNFGKAGFIIPIFHLSINNIH
jgi:hypothetical protein